MMPLPGLLLAWNREQVTYTKIISSICPMKGQPNWSISKQLKDLIGYLFKLILALTSVLHRWLG